MGRTKAVPATPEKEKNVVSDNLQVLDLPPCLSDPLYKNNKVAEALRKWHLTEEQFNLIPEDERFPIVGSVNFKSHATNLYALTTEKMMPVVEPYFPLNLEVYTEVNKIRGILFSNRRTSQYTGLSAPPPIYEDNLTVATILYVNKETRDNEFFRLRANFNALDNNVRWDQTVVSSAGHLRADPCKVVKGPAPHGSSPVKPPSCLGFGPMMTLNQPALVDLVHTAEEDTAEEDTAADAPKSPADEGEEVPKTTNTPTLLKFSHLPHQCDVPSLFAHFLAITSTFLNTFNLCIRRRIFHQLFCWSISRRSILITAMTTQPVNSPLCTSS